MGHHTKFVLIKLLFNELHLSTGTVLKYYVLIGYSGCQPEAICTRRCKCHGLSACGQAELNCEVFCKQVPQFQQEAISRIWEEDNCKWFQ